MAELLRQDQHVYVQVANILRNQVLYGQIKGKLSSIRELSELYSINFKTANKAVSLLVEEGLVQRIKGRGTYVVDGKPNGADLDLIGFIIADLANPNYARLAQSLQEKAYYRNLSVLVNTNARRLSRLRRILRLYEDRKVRAIIVQGGAVRSEECLKAVLDSQIPVIGEHTHLKSIDDVWVDVRAGAQLAVEHLIDTFRGSVAYVSGSDESVASTGRYQGYRDALLGRDMPVSLGLVKTAAPTYLGGYNAVRQLLDEQRVPRSIFFYNLMMAMGANNAIMSSGRQIPRDIAVAACDNSLSVDEMIVPTTTVAFSYEEEAKQLLSLVRRRLNNPKAEPMNVRIAPKLLVRSSTAPVDCPPSP